MPVKEYKKEGTTSTPFDMTVMNEIDRFNLAIDVIDRVLRFGPAAAYARQALQDKLIEHRQYVRVHGEDMPEIRDWAWPS